MGTAWWARLGMSTRARAAHRREPAELMDPSWPNPGSPSTGGVLFWLDARFCPSPMWDRSALCQELADWCTTAPRRDAVRIVTGPAGVGKSRLLVTIARHHLPKVWFAGQPDITRLDEVADRLLAYGQPTLLVIEDAERVNGLAAFLQRCIATPGWLRIVLTSRDGETLRFRLWQDPDTELSPVLRRAARVLPAIGHADDRQRWYAEASQHYARALRLPCPDVSGAAPVGQDGDTMFLLQARALLAVLDRPGARTLGLADIMRELVSAEQQWWERDPSLSAEWRTQPEMLAQVVGLLSLLPAQDVAQAGDRLQRFADEGARAALAQWARTRYPVGPDRQIEMRPRLVGDWLALQAADAVTAPLAGLDPDAVVSATAVVARACASFPQHLPVLWRVLREHPDVVGRTIPIVLAQGAASAAVNRGVEAAMLAAPRAQVDALLTLTMSPYTYPRPLHALRTLYLRRQRELVAAEPDRHRIDLAIALNELGISLSHLGRDQESLAVAEEAVGMVRELDAAEPDRHRPSLANFLTNLGGSLADMGRRPEALPVLAEAARIQRELAAAEPDEHRPRLALFLSNLAFHLREMGRAPDSIPVVEEAVGIQRELVATTTNRSDLAICLANLGGSLREAGRAPEAVPVHEEALRIRRDLAAHQPNRFRPELATSLNNLGVNLLAVGRPLEALALIEEAVEIRREWMAVEPDHYRYHLARSLTDLGNALRQTGRSPQACWQEALSLWSVLAERNPARFGGHYRDLADRSGD